MQRKKNIKVFSKNKEKEMGQNAYYSYWTSGVGKGTEAELLKEHYQSHISTDKY